MLTPRGISEAIDPEDTYIEIDDLEGLTWKDAPSEPKDKFAKVAISALETTSKRKATRLNKRLQNEGGDVKSKYIDEEFISGYALYDLARPPFELELLAALYDENATHNAAVNAKSLNTVGLGYKWVPTRKAKKKLEKAEDDESKYRGVMDALNSEMEKMDELFEAFHEEETFTETLIKATIDMYSLGNGYIEIGRNNKGEIGYIGHIPAHNLRIRRPRDGFVQLVHNRSKNQAVFFRNFGDTETPDPINNDPKPNEIIHLKVYSPSDQFYGIPHIVSALPAIVGDKFAKQYNIDYFENKSIPRYAIIIKGAKLSAAAKQELIQYFRNEVKGKNHGTLVIPLPATMGQQVDVKFEKLENGIQDGSFEKYRKSNRDEIVSAHRVPPTKVGIYDNANLAVSRDADKTFKEQVVGPEQGRIAKRVNRIVKEFTDLLHFEFVQLDIIDADMKSRIHDRYLRTEVLSPNEVRSEIGQPARKGGEEILPFITKVQQEKNEEDVKQRELDRKEGVKARQQGFGGRGAPVGNTNNPTNSGPDTPKDQTGTRNERGQSQDESGVRERS